MMMCYDNVSKIMFFMKYASIILKKKSMMQSLPSTSVTLYTINTYTVNQNEGKKKLREVMKVTSNKFKSASDTFRSMRPSIRAS